MRERVVETNSNSTEHIRDWIEVESLTLEGPDGPIVLTTCLSSGVGHDDPHTVRAIAKLLDEKFGQLRDPNEKPLILWEGSPDVNSMRSQISLKTWNEHAKQGIMFEEADVYQLVRWAYENGARNGGFDVSTALHQFAGMNIGPTRRSVYDFLKRANWEVGGALVAMMFLRKMDAGIWAIAPFVALTAQKISAMSKFLRGHEWSAPLDPDRSKRLKFLIDFRDKIMAINAYFAISQFVHQRSNSDTVPAVLIGAGNGHKAMLSTLKDLWAGSIKPQDLQGTISEDAESMFDVIAVVITMAALKEPLFRRHSGHLKPIEIDAILKQVEELARVLIDHVAGSIGSVYTEPQVYSETQYMEESESPFMELTHSQHTNYLIPNTDAQSQMTTMQGAIREKLTLRLPEYLVELKAKLEQLSPKR